MERYLGKELEGKILSWNYIPTSSLGILKIEEYPQNLILIRDRHLAANITHENLKVGTVCRFTVGINGKGQFRGHKLSLVVCDQKADDTGDNDKKSKSELFKFSLLTFDDTSMIDAKDIDQIQHSVSFFQSLPSNQSIEESNVAKNIFVDGMETFSSSQLSKLVSGLYSNTKKGNDVHAQQVESSYLEAASYLLHSDTFPNSLTLDVILELHRKATNQLLDSAGTLRHRGARVGSVHFPSSSQMLPLLRTFLDLCHTYLQSYFEIHSHESNISKNAVRDACTIAGWVGYHFVGIHPFSDGNGRTSRLLMSWVLKRCLSQPFVICLCPTPAQRSLYIAATRYADSKLMSKHIAQRCAVAWEEYFNTCTEAFKNVATLNVTNEQPPNSKAATTEGVVNAARVALRASGCLICMEDGPTISTLCCGQPLHFSCLSNWFTTRRRHRSATIDCPQCRCDISETWLDRIVPTGAANNDDSSTVPHDSIHTISANHSVDMERPLPRPTCINQACHNIRAGGCANNRCARCCPMNPGVFCSRHGTHVNNQESSSTAAEDESSDDDTSTYSASTETNQSDEDDDTSTASF